MISMLKTRKGRVAAVIMEPTFIKKKSKDRMDIKINRPLNEELTFSMFNKKEKHLRCGPQGQNNMVVGGVNECK